MGDDQKPTTIVKTSNIGMVLGILVVVFLGVYLYKSGFIANRFGKTAEVVTTPTPYPTPFKTSIQVEPEAINLLEEDTTTKEATKPAKIAKKVVVKHKPVDTAMGDNPLYLLALLLGSTGVTYLISHKLGE